jgi:hypothetical protein
MVDATRAVASLDAVQSSAPDLGALDCSGDRAINAQSSSLSSASEVRLTINFAVVSLPRWRWHS